MTEKEIWERSKKVGATPSMIVHMALENGDNSYEAREKMFDLFPELRNDPIYNQ